MDPRHFFVDSRHAAHCVYCGDRPTTVEHVPSKVLLDEPFPPNLPVVGACAACNNGFARDEEYVAVALECARHGTADPAVIRRAKVARRLREVPGLAERVRGAFSEPDLFGAISLTVERDRLERILVKLARGHASFEFGEPMLDEPAALYWSQLESLGAAERAAFEALPAQDFWPEIGSRAFLRAVAREGAVHGQGWQTVQPDRYRYLTSAGPFLVRIVLGEYLAAEVRWE